MANTVTLLVEFAEGDFQGLCGGGDDPTALFYQSVPMDWEESLTAATGGARTISPGAHFIESDIRYVCRPPEKLASYEADRHRGL